MAEIFSKSLTFLGENSGAVVAGGFATAWAKVDPILFGLAVLRVLTTDR